MGNNLTREEKRYNNLRKQSAKINAEIIKSKQRIEVLKKNNKGVKISDHAILRYLERVKHIDIEAIKKEMLPYDRIDAIVILGDGKFPINKCTAVVKNNTIITITV